MNNPRLRVVSLFCGLGGWDMGLHQAAADLGLDVEVVAAYDHWEPAVKCYNRNLPHPVGEVRDLKTMQRDELPPHDLVIGGPPCQPFSLAGKRKGHGDERNCLPDFLRLAGDSPYVMENVVARLINAPWSEKLCAADFGDVTSRKRWFYSTHLLHVIPTPGPLRFGDIRTPTTVRDRDANAVRSIGDDDFVPTFRAHLWHGYDTRGGGWLIDGRRCITLLEAQRAHGIPDAWDWCGLPGDPIIGTLIANSVPCGMAAGVSRAILTLLAREKGLAA